MILKKSIPIALLMLSFLFFPVEGEMRLGELRLIDESTSQVVDSIKMKTSDTENVCVQARFEETWVNVNAEWKFPYPLFSGPIYPPLKSHCVSIYSDNAISGFLIVKADSNSLSIPLTFINPDSNKLDSINIYTAIPPENCIYGDTLSAFVQFWTKNNKFIQNENCFDGIRYSLLNSNGNSSENAVLINDSIMKFDSNIRQCFNGGVSSVKFVLHDGSGENQKYQITVSYEGLCDSTEEFTLLPSQSVLNPEKPFQNKGGAIINRNGLIKFANRTNGSVVIRVARPNGQLVHYGLVTQCQHSGISEYFIPVKNFQAGCYIVTVSSLASSRPFRTGKIVIRR